ncbi:hypothetical protein [Escherichia coli]|uniref:hypothetical protein n=1 Tax=Escherichia coli TaxID=562 RepID=UPI00109E1E6A|nr:hypothetical protein [Escherichia coli]
MKKKLLFILFVILLIETGMRFTIWRELNNIIPTAKDYRFDIMVYDRIDTGFMGCIGHHKENYLTISYTLWLAKDVLWADIICQNRREYVRIFTQTNERYRAKDNRAFVYYHWSFKHWTFIDSYREQQEKINGKHIQSDK